MKCIVKNIIQFNEINTLANGPACDCTLNCRYKCAFKVQNIY